MWTYQIWPTQSFEWGWVGLLFLILSAASYYDIKSRIIPNQISFGGILGMALYVYLFPSLSISEHFLGALIGLLVFYSLFALNVFGGGDSKLLMFVSLSFGAPLLISVWLWIFIMGGLQAIFYRYFLKQKSLPYAVSITLGCCFYILSSLI
jgi:Flp pilus assembly protein protease CpaA